MDMNQGIDPLARPTLVLIHSLCLLSGLSK